MDNSLLLQLPTEIRLQIIEDSLDFRALKATAWYEQVTFQICRQMREEAFAVAYGTRDLIFELPDFLPHRLHRLGPWPSLVQVYDQHHTFQQDFAPHFLRSGDHYRLYKEFHNLGVSPACPFHAFRTIRIEIPAPNPEDPAQLIMTWNRLRWIARLLEKARNGLPDIRLVFCESQDRSWFTAGRLNISHQDLLVLTDYDANQPSDLMLLLSAVISLRQARSITVKVPPSAETDLRVQMVLHWLRSSAIQDCKWGESIPYNWEDWCYIEFLEHCELRFHQLLSSLETPIAPFLRLEQLASLTHFACHRMLVVSRENPNFPSTLETRAIMKQVICAAITLAPLWPPATDDCKSCGDWITGTKDEYSSKCRGKRESHCWDVLRHKLESQNWDMLGLKRDDEILLQRDFLDEERAAASLTSPSSKGIEKTPALKASSDPCLSEVEEIAFESCGCFHRGRLWMEKFPDGVAPYNEVI